jgi:acyl carrier protein
VGDAQLLEAVASAIRAEVERIDAYPILLTTRLVEDLNLDSIDLVGITMRLEDRFHVEIDVQEIKNFRSVADLVDQIAILIGKSAA